jgi:hypothetical protein
MSLRQALIFIAVTVVSVGGVALMLWWAER